MKIWYSIFKLKPYRGSEPTFYRRENFSWTEIIESNGKEIKRELSVHLLSNPQLISCLKQQKINHHDSWKTMPLMTWGVEFHKNITNFPVTTKILNQIPGLVSASFNLLEKNSEITPHFGETNASVRVHLGLFIPDKTPKVGFKVNDISRSWVEEKILIFCDGYEHTAWNHSNQNRYILLLDIIKPEFIHRKKLICGNVLAILSLQSLASKSNFLFYRVTPLNLTT